MLLTQLPENLLKITSTYPMDWDETRIFQELSLITGIPYVELHAEQVDTYALRIYPLSMCREHGFLPIYRSSTVAIFAVTKPWLEPLKQMIVERCYDEVRFVAITRENFENLMDYVEMYVNSLPKVTRVVETPNKILGWGNTTATTLVRKMIQILHKADASDIHFEPLEDRLVIRYRWNGELRVLQTIDGRFKHAVLDAVKTLALLPVSDRNTLKDSRISVDITHDYKINLRMVALPTQHGENIVLRILDPEKITQLMGRLPFAGQRLDLFNSCINRDQGLIMITGPTGSGKTTTLYSALLSLDLSKWKICTVEDPIEYTLPKINQYEVNPNNDVTTSKALKAILRADPDVILVGEIRDEETASLAVSAANTGHLVLSTLHTNDAITIISRLEELKVSRSQIQENLTLGIAQRLVRLNCPHCRIQSDVTPDIRKHFEFHHVTPPEHLFTSCGCIKCHNTGIGGRKPVFQFLYIDGEIRTALIQGKTLEDIRVMNGHKQGPVIKDALELVAAGLTSYPFVSGLETEFVA